MDGEIYSIRVKGHLDSNWSEWLGGVTITHNSDGTTTLSGTINDQAALHALLIRIRDLGLHLIGVDTESPC